MSVLEAAMPDPQLIIFAGLPGTGKSSLARAVARELKAVYLDKDTMKIVFDSDKCIACELCVRACPPRAMVVNL